MLIVLSFKPKLKLAYNPKKKNLVRIQIFCKHTKMEAVVRSKKNPKIFESSLVGNAVCSWRNTIFGSCPSTYLFQTHKHCQNQNVFHFSCGLGTVSSRHGPGLLYRKFILHGHLLRDITVFREMASFPD